MCAGAEDAHAQSMVHDAGRAQDGRAHGAQAAQAAQAAAFPQGMKKPRPAQR